MEPKKLTIMLDQWARAHAPDFFLFVEGVNVALLGVADSEVMNDSTERGGFFAMAAATITVSLRPALIDPSVWGNIGINEIRRRRGQPEEFERLFLKLCHDIWMTKDLAVRGRVVVVN